MNHAICPPHQKRVDVLDHVMVHAEDGSICWSPILCPSRGGITTPGLVRVRQPESIAAQAARAGP